MLTDEKVATTNHLVYIYLLNIFIRIYGMITLERLRYFKAAAEMEHINNAAKVLRVSPSSVSSAIQVLESEMQCQLFERRNRKFYLNKEGHQLLARCKLILNSVKELPFAINKQERPLVGHFVIAATPFLMRSMLIPAVLNLKKTNPGLNAEFIAADTGLAAKGVEAGDYDCALIVRSVSFSSLFESPLYQGSFQFVVRKNHPILRAKVNERVNLLNSLPALTFKPFSGPNLVENHPAFRQLGLEPQKTDYFNDNQTAEILLKNSDAWAFLPDKALKTGADSALSTINLGKNSWKAPYSIYLVKKKQYQEIFTPLETELLKQVNDKKRGNH